MKRWEFEVAVAMLCDDAALGSYERALVFLSQQGATKPEQTLKRLLGWGGSLPSGAKGRKLPSASRELILGQLVNDLIQRTRELATQAQAVKERSKALMQLEDENVAMESGIVWSNFVCAHQNLVLAYKELQTASSLWARLVEVDER